MTRFIFSSPTRICLSILGLLSGAASLGAKTVETTHESFAVQAGDRLLMELGYGDIEIRTTEDPRVRIEVVREVSTRSEDRERRLLDEDALSISQRDGIVRIQSNEVSERSSLWRVFPGFKVKRDYRYRVSVPMAFNVVLESGSGSITVKGLQGNVSARTSDGDLRFTETRGAIDGSTSGGSIQLESCSGEITLKTSGGPVNSENGNGTFHLGTSGGSITIEGHRGAISTRTSGGTITASGIDGRIDGHTSGGAIRVALGVPTGDCHLSTSGGAIAVSLPPGTGVGLDAATVGGAVRSDLPVDSEADGSRNRLNGTINGGGPLLHLRTSGGSIRILDQ